MPLRDYVRVYARQEYLTPGDPETVDLIVDGLQGLSAPRIVEVASGKGEAACALATRTGGQVTAVDRSPAFLLLARQKAVERGLASRVRLLHADGKQLPFPDGTFDAGCCMGAPSIVGLEPCLQELRRTVRQGGSIVVSDIYWHHRPEEPLGPEWGWLATETWRPALDEYRAAITAAGLVVEQTFLHPREAWDAYHAPMRLVVAEERARGEDAFADEVERGIEVEQRGVDAFLGYVTFVARVARRPG